MVTVVVAIVTIVAVVAIAAVIATARGGSVQHIAKVVVLAPLVEILKLRNEILVKETGPQDEDCPVDKLVDDLGVSNDVHRRAVDDDIIVLGLQIFDKLTELWISDELGRVRRDGTDRENLEGRVVRRLDYYSVNIINLSGQVVTETLLRGAGEL